MREQKDNPLGQPTEYADQYDPSLLHAIPRQLGRNNIGLTDATLPFSGEDRWHAYEFSWLNEKGMPKVAILRIEVPCQSPNIVESKSLKLYLNSFNQTRIANQEQVLETIKTDLEFCCESTIELTFLDVEAGIEQRNCEGICLDYQDIRIDTYEADPSALACIPEGKVVDEVLYSHLLRSNCLITKQPDWATVFIRYRGTQMEREALLRYLVSFRTHSEFHEQCVERMYTDIKAHCQPEKLQVYAFYTRRGGIDISPIRGDAYDSPPYFRTTRQ